MYDVSAQGVDERISDKCTLLFGFLFFYFSVLQVLIIIIILKRVYNGSVSSVDFL